MRLYININQKAKEEIKTKGSTKLPYLRFTIPPEEGQEEWKDFGAAWMTDKKIGFNMKLSPGWSLTFKETPEMQTERENKEFKEQARITALKEKEGNEKTIEYPSEEIDPGDIPF